MSRRERDREERRPLDPWNDSDSERSDDRARLVSISRDDDDDDETRPTSRDDDDETRPTSSWEILSNHRGVMGVFCFASVVSTASTSVPFPFLGNDFRRAGLPPFLVGVVFSALPAGVLVASPFAQRLSWRFGAKRCVVCGLLAQAAAVALCVLGGESGYVVWGVMRLLQGMAIALESVTMLCVVTRAVPDAVSIAAGLQEVSAGFGTLIGPIIGGYLYDAGGSSPTLPLLVNAALVLLAAPVVSRALETVRNVDAEAPREDEEKPKFRRLLANPTFVAIATAALVISTSFGGIPTTLPLHLRKTLNLSASNIGVVYAILAGLYAVITPIVGMISHDSLVGDVALAVVGMGCMSIAHLLFGPSALLRESSEVSDVARWNLNVLAASCVYGLGSALAFVPLLPLLQAAVKREGPMYVDMVNGVFVSLYFSGELLGQLFGASLASALGYPGAGTLWALALLVVAGILIVVEGAHAALSGWWHRREERAEDEDEEAGLDGLEEALLLDDSDSDGME